MNEAERFGSGPGGAEPSANAGPSGNGEQDQSAMVFRLPRTTVVDRISFVTDAARGRRVAHVGFADAGFRDMQEGAGAWLHGRLACVASSLVGIDVDTEGVEVARRRGLEAYAVDCRDAGAVAALELEPFELVIAGEVIEHVDAPGAFLDGLHALVAPDGLLIVTTPNAAALGNTLSALLGYEVIHPDHVGLFTWRTLTNLMTRHDWKPVAVHTSVPAVKPGAQKDARLRVAQAAANGMLWVERTVGRWWAPFIAEGLIVVARPETSFEA